MSHNCVNSVSSGIQVDQYIPNEGSDGTQPDQYAFNDGSSQRKAGSEFEDLFGPGILGFQPITPAADEKSGNSVQPVDFAQRIKNAIGELFRDFKIIEDSLAAVFAGLNPTTSTPTPTPTPTPAPATETPIQTTQRDATSADSVSAPVSGYDNLIGNDAFRQGSKVNCVSVAVIKDALAQYGDGIFKSKQSDGQGGLNVELRDGTKVHVSADELNQARAAADFQGGQGSKTLELANIAYAAIAKREATEQGTSFGAALNDLGDGFAVEDASRLLGLQCKRFDPSQGSAPAGPAIDCLDNHAAFKDANGDVDLWGSVGKDEGKDVRTKDELELRIHDVYELFDNTDQPMQSAMA